MRFPLFCDYSRKRICFVLGAFVCLFCVGCGPADRGSVKKEASQSDLADTTPSALKDLGVPEAVLANTKSASVDKDGKEVNAKGGAKSKVSPTGVLLPSDTVFSIRKPWIKSDQLPNSVFETVFLGNKPVGYTSETIRTSSIGTEGILRLESKQLLRVVREGVRMNQTLDILSVEEADGRVRSIEATLKVGDSTKKTTVSPVLDRLKIRVEDEKGIQAKEIKWSPQISGPFGIMQSLRREPPKPGETRSFQMFDVVIGEIVDIELVAGDFHLTPLVNGDQEELQEVRATARRGKTQQEILHWIDRQGVIQKSFSVFTDLRSFRCDEKLSNRVRDALAIEQKSVWQSSLKTTNTEVETAPKLRFQLYVREREAVQVVPQDNFQRIDRIEPLHVYYIVSRPPVLKGYPSLLDEIAVRRIESSIDSDYRDKTPILQTEDTMVQKMAKQWSEDESLGENPVERMSRGVQKHFTKLREGYQSMETAAETIRTKRGGVHERAILLMAVLRSQGYATRLATGVRYSIAAPLATGDSKKKEVKLPERSEPSMAYHAWVEYLAKGSWLPIDPSREELEVNSTYLRLAESPLADENPFAVVLETLDKIEKLSIEIE
jgi:hypothetical protein